jgi:hypothetical protein
MKTKTMLLTLCVLVPLLALAVWSGFGMGAVTNDVPEPVACTMDAKICADGSAVGRTGPKCEFAPCPGEGNTVPPNEGKVAAGYIVGQVTIGPFCPVEQVGRPCTVPPEAYSTRKVIVYESNGTTMREKTALDSEGTFKITLGPGTYWVQIEPAGIGPGEKKQVTVTSFETTTVNFDIDTGIR